MSGGVDSAVAAVLLKEAGWRVFGITALLTRERSRCCAPEDVLAATDVCERLGIAHHVVDVCDEFERAIVQCFMAEYTAGRTPSPCPVCNRHIKFGLLAAQARALGAERIATGHYARVATGQDGLAQLRRGVDRAKDQSYFLALLTQEQLRSSTFPLGGMSKPDVRRIASERGLPVATRRESQEVCFVPDGEHGPWIDLRSFDTRGPGDMIDTGGVRIGRHKGVHYYTVGQRRGLGLAVGAPLYVVALDRERNAVVVGSRNEALRSRMCVRGCNWAAGRPPAERFRCSAQIRHSHAAAPATVGMLADGAAEVEFDEPQFAIAPGQLAVFYGGDLVLGGGWID
jgi:tRNA-specific 2-thiouridylase